MGGLGVMVEVRVGVEVIRVSTADNVCLTIASSVALNSSRVIFFAQAERLSNKITSRSIFFIRKTALFYSGNELLSKVEPLP
jgi:hypothetical protein